MNESIQIHLPEALTIPQTQEHIWALICGGYNVTHILSEAGLSEDDYYQVLSSDQPDSLASILGIDIEKRSVTETLSILGFATGRYSLPAPRIKVVLFPQLPEKQNKYPITQLHFGEGITPIIANSVLGFTLRQSAFLLDKDLSTIKRRKQQANSKFRRHLPIKEFEDVSLMLQIQTLASQSQWRTKNPLINRFIKSWNKEHTIY